MISRLEIHNILLPVNNSIPSRRAAEIAAKFSKEDNTTIHLLHCIEDRLSHYGHVDHLAPQHVKDEFVSYVASEYVREAEEMIKMFVQEFQRRGVKHSVQIREGKPLTVIMELVEEKDIDLVIIGSNRPGRMDLFGEHGLVKKLTKKCPCLVMVIF